jgi:hypothetical protein
VEFSEPPEYLARAGWPGGPAPARGALAPYAALATETTLLLDVGSCGIVAGLRCSIPRRQFVAAWRGARKRGAGEALSSPAPIASVARGKSRRRIAAGLGTQRE